MLRQWAMTNALWSLVFLPIGAFTLVAALVVANTRKSGGTLLQGAVWISPLFVLEALYYAWVLDLSPGRPLIGAVVASILFLAWARLLDQATRAAQARRRTERDREAPPFDDESGSAGI